MHTVVLKGTRMLPCVICFVVLIGGAHPHVPGHRHVTYQVQQLYQACPPKGKIVVNGSDIQGSDILNAISRLRELEVRVDKLGSLPDRQNNLEAKLSALKEHCRNDKEVKSCENRNITRENGKYPRDCAEIYTLGGRATGVYTIQPKQAPKPIRVLCELGLDGGWTVIMRRFDGSVDFYRRWSDYKKGFGSFEGEFWLGNDNIHWLTSQKNYRLHIDMRYWDNKTSYYASYDRFSIESEARKYRLHITGFKGNVGYEGLRNFNGMAFSTWDRDNDTHNGVHCAQMYKGAFWYNSCIYYCYPMGRYRHSCSKRDCMVWGKERRALDQIKMKVKHI